MIVRLFDVRGAPGMLLAAALLLPALAHAQAWPAKPVKVIAANSPGAATDLAARVFVEGFARIVKQPVTLENRPGADGYIAAQAVAAAEPDGYTLFFASQSVFALDPNIKRQMPVDPDRDFTPIAIMLDDTGAAGIYVNAASPFKAWPDVVQFAKANPGKLTYATTVPLFSMLGEWLKKRSGIDMTEVPYKTVGQANQDAIAGRVSMIITAFGPFETYLKAGKVRVLMVSRPVADYPQLPTVGGLYPGYEQPTFIILAGPGRMAPELALRINRAAARVVEDPAFNVSLAKVRWRNVGGARTPDQVAAFIRAERARWGDFVREAGIEPQ